MVNAPFRVDDVCVIRVNRVKAEVLTCIQGVKTLKKMERKKLKLLEVNLAVLEVVPKT